MSVEQKLEKLKQEGEVNDSFSARVGWKTRIRKTIPPLDPKKRTQPPPPTHSPKKSWKLLFGFIQKGRGSNKKNVLKPGVCGPTVKRGG